MGLDATTWWLQIYNGEEHMRCDGGTFLQDYWPLQRQVR